MQKLVKKARKGDKAAFMALIEAFEDDIYRTAYVYVKNENDALDVAQETAARAFSRISSLKEPEYFKTWLIKITINASIDLLRSKKKIVQLEPEYYESIEKQDENIPLSLTLRSLLEELTEREKGIILLKYYHGHTFTEISTIMEMPAGSIKSVLYRALHKMRYQMKEEDIYEQ